MATRKYRNLCLRLIEAFNTAVILCTKTIHSDLYRPLCRCVQRLLRILVNCAQQKSCIVPLTVHDRATVCCVIRFRTDNRVRARNVRKRTGSKKTEEKEICTHNMKKKRTVITLSDAEDL